MKNIFEAFAIYNRAVNRELSGILEKLTREQIMQNEKTFYPTIFDTLLHIFMTDLAWIRRFITNFPDNPVFVRGGYSPPDDASLKNDLEKDYKNLFNYRNEMDEALLSFISGLSENNFNSVIVYKNFKGETVEKDLWKTLMQLFNHQTHHRGSISALLDLLGIDNDYSTLLTKI